MTWVKAAGAGFGHTGPMKPTLLPSQTAAVCSLFEPCPAVDQGIVSRAVLTTPGLRLTLFHFAPGQELSEHTSKARALVQALTGTCVFTVGTTVHTLKPGDLLHLPPGMPHSLTAPEGCSMLLTQVTEAQGAKS